MRIFTLGAMLGLLFLPQAGLAEEKDAIGQGTPRAAAEISSAGRSAAVAKAARDKAEALERAWDHKMREVSKGICTGC